MPQFSLANYIALRSLVSHAERSGVPHFVVTPAKSALVALRRFFPSFEQWEREQAAREKTP